MNKVILGLHYGPSSKGVHDGGAALLCGDELVAVSEERLSRVKYDSDFNGLAIQYALDHFDLSINDVDLIVYDRFLFLEHREYYTRNLRRLFPEINFDKLRLEDANHHFLHACSGYFFSGFSDAAIMIVDGEGERFDENGEITSEILSFYHGHGVFIDCIKHLRVNTDVNPGLGHRWEDVTHLIGFSHRDPGKTMGLAPYGKVRSEHAAAVTPVFFDDDPGLVESLEVRTLDLGPLEPELTQGWRAEPVKRLTFVLQEETNQILTALAMRLRERTRCDNLVMAGGVALNSVANFEILSHASYKNVFIQPASSDTGIPLGAIAYGSNILLRQGLDFSKFDYALGRCYSSHEIEEAVSDCESVRVLRSIDITKDCARLIASGQIIGWFQGGSEIGPRALGNRSILCSPAGSNTKDRLNARVKFREGFRPFAAAVLEEYVSDYFEFSGRSPHMLLVVPVRQDRKSDIAAVTHVDGSCRLQTVGKDQGIFRLLLSRFMDITGLPLVLNTSLNVRGEPIVETPKDALEVLVNTQLDTLALGDYLVTKL